MSSQLFNEMISILKETYKSNYQRYYRHVHVTAVEQHEKDGGTRKIVETTEYYNNQLLGQLELIYSIGYADPDVYEFYNEQYDLLLTKFDSYSLFGVGMAKDGYIYGGDEAGRLIVKDQEAWKEAEKSAEESRRLKAERARRKETTMRL